MASPSLKCFAMRHTCFKQLPIFSPQRQVNMICHRKLGVSSYVHRLKRRPYDIVTPAKVSPRIPTPYSIPKPDYAIRGTSAILVPEEPEIKTEEQIEGTRKACALAASVLKFAGSYLKVGMTTDELDKAVHELCLSKGAYPSPLLYRGYPKSICTSVNNVVCHGIPDSRKLKDGDIVNVDITVYFEGYHGDTSATFLVGNVDSAGRNLVDAGRRCRDAGVAVCRHGAKFNDIGKAISECAVATGYTVVPEFCGHGIGEYFHGPPDIFHIDLGKDLGEMKEGMTFTIEPIISEGSPDFKILPDGWTAVSIDNSRSAQFEHTVLVTRTGVEILTL